MTADQSVSRRPEKPSLNFEWPEFACHDALGTTYPLDWWERGVSLAIELERIRVRIGPFTPTSVYRTWPAHKRVYASLRPPQTAPAGSRHLTGEAADVPCPDDMTFSVFVQHIKDAAAEPGSKIRYVKLYRGDAFAHVDIRQRDAGLLVEYAT